MNVCFPTLNRYDLLNESIASLQRGILKPTDIFVIDNGGKLFPGDFLEFTDEFDIRHHYVNFHRNLGCAASWNWFARNTSEVRIISNDDIAFQPDSLRKLVYSCDPLSITSPENIIGSNSFSCFTLPDYLYNAVGEFDEAISPNYCYYEDVDQSRRLRLAGFKLRGVAGCNVDHLGSSTLKSYTAEELQDHHERFQVAAQNYAAKWGGNPGEERFKTPYNQP